jgi:Domain of unknown function (DUF1844)
MEEEKSYTVRDRRIRHDDEGGAEPAPEAPDKAAPPKGEAPERPGPAPTGAAAAGAAEPADAGQGFSMSEEGPSIDFSAFVFSLARTALIHMGLENHPETGIQDANLQAARETIDVLGMMEEKTRGNLTPEETELIAKMLYTLRMSYVEVARAASSG